MKFLKQKSRKFDDSEFKHSLQSALLEACSEGDEARVEVLLQSSKLDIFEMEKEIGKAPLHVAVSNYSDAVDQSGHKKIVQLLLSKGANLYLSDNAGWTIAGRIFREKKGLIDIILNYMTNFNKELLYSGLSALHLAVESCSEDIVKKLLKWNSDVNIATRFGLSVLHMAVMNDRLDIIDLLIQHGADVNFPDVQGFRPLHFAKSGNMIRKLVKSGATIDAMCSRNDTPLILSVKSKRKVDVIQALLDCGATYNDVNIVGKSAFDYIERSIADGNDLIVYSEMVEIFGQHVKSRVPAEVNDDLTQRIRRLDEELMSVKTKKMGNSTVTFWQLINANEREAAKYLRNGEIKEAINNHNFNTFKRALQKIYFTGTDRKVYENVTRDSLSEIFNNMFPVQIIDEIVSYLSTQDLKILAILRQHSEFKRARQSLKVSSEQVCILNGLKPAYGKRIIEKFQNIKTKQINVLPNNVLFERISE